MMSNNGMISNNIKAEKNVLQCPPPPPPPDFRGEGGGGYWLNCEEGGNSGGGGDQDFLRFMQGERGRGGGGGQNFPASIFMYTTFYPISYL